MHIAHDIIAHEVKKSYLNLYKILLCTYKLHI